MQDPQLIKIDISTLMALVNVIDMFYSDSISTLSDLEQRTQLVNAITTIAEETKGIDTLATDNLLILANDFAKWPTDTDGEEDSTPSINSL